MSLQLFKTLLISENKYSRWYIDIIENALQRSSPKEQYEKHHIVPESFFIERTRKGKRGTVPGNPNQKDNFVLLTIKEHYICHLLLCRVQLPTNLHLKSKSGMGRFTSNKHHRILPSRYHLRAKKNVSEAASERMKEFKHTEETKQKMRVPKRSKENYKNHRPLTVWKDTVYMNNKFKEKRVSKNEIDQYLVDGFTLGKLQFCCTICNKTMDLQNFKRYHSNC